ncbi:MAG: aminodeoxychorismate lyase [Gammaproteobacteria bacterium]|nr:MAG: aminodeoxychorismate lyase [Gammaproteobacteria bacterium]
MILINGKTDDRINIADRGLQYGDGVFETLAYRNGDIELLEAHLSRLVLGCERLKISFSDLALLRAELNQLGESLTSDTVIKIIVTRGRGGRGYFADSNSQATRIISTHPYPQYPEAYKLGVTVRLCHHRLADNPTLAGIKHLNRLDQVLARNEWDSTEIAEGLMFDQTDNLIEGTMTNLFIVKSEQLITPSLTQSGVKGVMRDNLIQLAEKNGLTVQELKIQKRDLVDADEVLVCNSINGIWPVVSIVEIDKRYAYGPVTQQLQHWLEDSNK